MAPSTSCSPGLSRDAMPAVAAAVSMGLFVRVICVRSAVCDSPRWLAKGIVG